MDDPQAPAVWLHPDQLTPWAKNPRSNKAAIAKVAKSIEAFGFGTPIVARLANREVIAGHTRLEAAKRLKLTRVPVRLLDVSEDQAHQLALANNRLGEEADWDANLLREVASAMTLSELQVAGFDAAELTARPEVTTRPVDVETSTIAGRFIMTISGPLPAQPDVLQLLRASLADVAGVQVQCSTDDKSHK